MLNPKWFLLSLKLATPQSPLKIRLSERRRSLFFLPSVRTPCCCNRFLYFSFEYSFKIHNFAENKILLVKMAESTDSQKRYPKRIPYGMMNFVAVRRDGCYYVDNTLYRGDRACQQVLLLHPPASFRQEPHNVDATALLRRERRRQVRHAL